MQNSLSSSLFLFELELLSTPNIVEVGTDDLHRNFDADCSESVKHKKYIWVRSDCQRFVHRAAKCCRYI